MENVVRELARIDGGDALTALCRPGILADLPAGVLQILSDKRISRLSKASYMKHFLPCKPVLRFIWMYFFKLGFLDGRHGFWVCVLASFYEAIVDAKYWLMVRCSGNANGQESHG